MNILLIGSGGREHAFAEQLSKSAHCSQLYIMPGNAGTAQLGKNITINPNDFPAVAEFCISNNIKLLVVGPEEPLVRGIRDYFEADEKLAQIAFVGPGQAGAIMEGSKDWSKAFMLKYGVPTAAYQTFTAETITDGIEYVKKHSLPVVLKADGLAAGKGVLICQTHEEAVDELSAMIANKKFGDASKKVVIEEFMHGIECSVFVLMDGVNYVILPVAKDYKRIGEGETGLNTGGMGAISPVPFADEIFMQKVKERIVEPTVFGLSQEGISYKGFVFVGLMAVNNEPFVIEYNCRMGDPETEAVLPRIQNDFVELMMATSNGSLNKVELQIDPRAAATIMLVSKGYPEDYEKGFVMSNFEEASGSKLYHAGTKISENNEILSNGGRVLAITSLADTIQEAVKISRENAEKIEFENKYYRRDIGFEFM
jgi:phosphoribosylamine--glycine ligase